MDLERREERPATPAEIETGVYAEDFDDYQDDVRHKRQHAAEEESAQLLAQWKILGARWLELSAHQSKNTKIDPLEDPIPWDHRH